MRLLLVREIRKSIFGIFFKMLIQTMACVGIAVCALYVITLSHSVNEFIAYEKWGNFSAVTSVDLKQLDGLGVKEDHIYYARGAECSLITLKKGSQSGTINAGKCLFYSSKNIDATSFFCKASGFFAITETREFNKEAALLSEDIAAYAGVESGDIIKVEHEGLEKEFIVRATFFCEGIDVSLILPCTDIEEWKRTEGDSVVGCSSPTSYLAILKTMEKKGTPYQDRSGLLSVRDRTVIILWILFVGLLVSVFAMIIVQMRQNRQLLSDRKKHIEVLYLSGYSMGRISLLYVSVLAVFHVLMAFVVGMLFSVSVFYINHVLESFFVLTQSFCQKAVAVLLPVAFSLIMDGLTGWRLYRRMEKKYKG